MVWLNKEGGGIPSDAVKLAVPGVTNKLGSVVVSPADLRPYRVVQAGSEEPSLDTDQSHYVPLGEPTAIEAYIDIVDIPAPTAGSNVITEVPPNMDRNNYSGMVGYEFTVDQPEVLMSLSRPIGSTFAQNHQVGVWKVLDQSLVDSVTITPSSPAVDGFAVESLGTPALLEPGTYRIASEEFSGGDNWEDAGVTLSTSSDIADIKGTYLSGSGFVYPTNISPTPSDVFVWPGMQFADHAVNLYMETIGDQSFEIDWDNGSGFVEAQSATELYGSYPTAKTSGIVTLKYPEGVLPEQLLVRSSATNSLRITSEQVASINRYNSLQNLEYGINTHQYLSPAKEFRKGSALESYQCRLPFSVTDVEWHTYISRCEKLEFIYLQFSGSGSLDLDQLTVSPQATYIRFRTGDVEVQGDYVAFVSRHPVASSIDIQGNTDSSIALESNPAYASALDYVSMNLPLTTPQVDKILNALATRSSPAWSSNKTVSLVGNCAPPSAQGLLDKAAIEAQPGSPIVSVNS